MRLDDLISIEPASGRARLINSEVYVDDIVEGLSNGNSIEDLQLRFPKLKPEEVTACTYFSVVRKSDQKGNSNLSMESDALELAIKSLKVNSIILTILGVILLAGTVALGLVLFLDIKATTESHIGHFGTEANYALLAYLIARSAALTAVATALLFFGIKTAVACFDQSARFTKRRYGALFLKYLYGKFDNRQLHTPEGIEQIIKFFQAWNHNIESAFSGVRVEKGKTGLTEIKVGKDGASLKTDDRDN